MRTDGQRRVWWLPYRVRSVLAVIALLPLVGAGWFAVGEVLSARAEREQAEGINRAIDDLVALSELRSRVLDEQNWTAAEVGIDQLGLPAEFVESMTGIDIPARSLAASTGVDRLMADLGIDDDLALELAGIRDGLPERELADTGEQYRAFERRIAELSNARFDAAIEGASDVTDGGSLIASVRVFRATTVARQAVSAEFNHYFGAQFSVVTKRTDEIRGIIDTRALRVDAMNEAVRLAADTSRTAAVLDLIATSSAANSFDESSDAVVDANIRGEAPESALSAVLDDLSAVSRDFENASVTTEMYFDLVTAAGEDVASAAQIARAGAQSRNRQAVILLVGLVVLSGIAATAATRTLVRPLHRLADTARRLSTGQDGIEELPESGPHEMRDVARALNQASHTLALAERQALALAEGELDHASLQSTTVGTLGASLQGAVRTLATSLQEREKYRRRMTHEATHDGLTQLPNRNASLDRLAEGLAGVDRGGKLAVLFVDVDGFKHVNDRYGHHAGDHVLRVTASRLAAALRPTDHAGRLGGDEFVVIAEPVVDAEDAISVAKRIQDALTEPIEVENATVTIGSSVGIALNDSETTASELLRDADIALYHAKELGRDRIEVCTPALQAAMAERMDIEQALTLAIMRDEFELHFQAIVNARSRATVGYEALVRWHRPGFGLVPPNDFIPVAERSDLIVEIDRWVIENAAAQIAAWTAAGQITTEAVSVNISGRHLTNPDFVEHVLAPLRRHGVHPAALVVEITESAIFDEPVTAAAKLETLRERGIRVAIDDFGTGYTSLNHLRSLPVDILKIDQSFTRDESAASLAQLIVSTGHLLGATVTAEGIETPLQADCLQRMGSDELQGYFFGKPVPVDQIDFRAVSGPETPMLPSRRASQHHADRC